MAGSIYGKCFQITTWGESHGEALGVVIDGCPAGLPLCQEDIQKDMDRRKPGASAYATKRQEGDEIKILSGVFEGKTTGTPISLIVFNTNQRSADYDKLKDCFRPGHADYTFYTKYGLRDYRGGGRSSGRETLCRVAAGAVARKLLAELGISIDAYTRSIGEVEIDSSRFLLEERFSNPLVMPDSIAAKAAEEYLKKCAKTGDSAGGIIECVIRGTPAGLGETVFDKLDAQLGKAMFSIGAVKGVEFGDGFAAAKHLGSENNDGFLAGPDGIIKLSNHSGGILGGMSDGSPINFRVALKPTPSISKLQKTVNTQGDNVELSITGRHDPVIVPRAVVVVEAMAAVTLADFILENMTATVAGMKNYYRR